MKRQYALISIALCSLLVAIYVVSCSHHSSAAHSIDSVSVAPSEIPTGSITQVTAIATITDPAIISNSVELVKIASDGTESAVGTLISAGKNTYRIQFPIHEAVSGQSRFAVQASFKGSSSKVTSQAVSVISLSVPTGFAADPGPLSSGGPLSLDNFDHTYVQGGIIPEGGAVIDATEMSLPSGSLNDYIARVELEGALIQTTSNPTIDGITCTGVKYLDVYTSVLSYENDAVYCPSGSLLHKFFLSYHDDDTNAGTYESAFQQVIGSAILKD